MVFLGDIDTDAFRSLSMGARAIYMVLTIYAAQSSREAWPSQSTVAGVVGVRREYVNKAIKQLCEAGFLHKRKQDRRGLPSLTVYTLLSP